jgi:ribosomal protein S18 acetylase RimI-like enzyme
VEFRLLDDTDQPAIHATFLRAFSDYAVPADFDRSTLERLMVRRGTDLSASVGAFDDGNMVAVMAVAVREFERILSAYDVFTGVLPSHRGQRLAGRMFDTVRGPLVKRGVRQFLLEVIESNTGAIKAYERTGFVTRRQLNCFEVPAAALRPVGPPDGVIIERGEGPDWSNWRPWRSWPVSWQNSAASIEAAVEEVRILFAYAAGERVGYAIVVPAARDLPQLVVRPGWRRRGVGTALLAEATRQMPEEETLRVINIDATALPDLAFFARFGEASLPAQREMLLDFGA